jgi:tRNA pseudouridine55 synthase
VSGTQAGPGILLVDKPGGMTSHDVVARARKRLGTRRVGHAGTLDPMATGLLVLGFGAATRLLTYLVGLDKTYEATIRLGESTSTDDAEGESTGIFPVGFTDDDLAAQVRVLTGDILQRPSTVSAIRVGGKRAYALVRAGEDVELAPRPVTVTEFAVLAIRRTVNAVDVDVRISCTSGTYIRALARDLGTALRSGGHLTALRRTRIGPFEVSGAAPVEDAAILPPADVAGALFPVTRLDEQRAWELAHGGRVAVQGADAPIVAAIGPDGRLIGLIAVEGGRSRVLANFPAAEGESEQPE